MNLLIIFCAQYLIYLMGAAFVVFLVWKFSWDKLVVTVVSLPVAYVLAKIAGHLYSHIQPFAAQGVAPLIPHVVDNAFPSDHMLLASTIAMLALVYNRSLGALLWACALAVGAARMVALLHYPVDITASVLIAVAVVVAVAKLSDSYLIQR